MSSWHPLPEHSIVYTAVFFRFRSADDGYTMAETRRFIAVHEAKPPFFVGIDLGGTNIKVGVVDDLGRPLSWLSIPTEVEKGAEDGARTHGRGRASGHRRRRLEPSAIARVGLGSPGEMDIPSGMLLTPINLKGWNNFPIRDRVSHHCGLPVDFENDANAAAYGEFWVGSGREFQSMVLLTLGTGIGCGIIIGDMVVQGAHSHGGEAGHASSTAAKTPGCAAAAARTSGGLCQRHRPSSGGPRRLLGQAPSSLSHADRRRRRN